MKVNSISNKESANLANTYFHKKLSLQKIIFYHEELMDFIDSYRSIFWVYECHLPCLKINFLSFDIKQDIL